jgi:hypothetical protein
MPGNMRCLFPGSFFPISGDRVDWLDEQEETGSLNRLLKPYEGEEF